VGPVGHSPVPQVLICSSSSMPLRHGYQAAKNPSGRNSVNWRQSVMNLWVSLWTGIIMLGFSVCLSSCGNFGKKSPMPPEPQRIEWGVKGEKPKVPQSYDWFCADLRTYKPEMVQ
jgi:hypothetical protein